MMGGIRLFIQSYFSNGTTQTTLLHRTELLCKTNQTKVINGMQSIDCGSLDLKTIFDSYVVHIFESAMQKNSYCKCVNERKLISHFDITFDDELWAKMQRGTNVNFFKNIACSKCKQNLEVNFSLRQFLFFVMERNLMWDDIPKIVIFQGQHYELTGVIVKFRTYYCAHALRPNKKWYSFDHTDKQIKKSVFKYEMNVHALCYARMTNFDEFENQYILYNTHTLEDKKKSIRISNACAPNAILHCLVSFYIDAPELFINKSSVEDIIKFFIAYIKRDKDLMYSIRYKIFKPHFKIQKDSDNMLVMSCFTNITGILHGMLVNVLPSLTIWCSCSETIRQNFSVVDLDYRKLTHLGLGKLEQCVSYPKRVCVQCNGGIKNISLGNILFFDVQALLVKEQGIEIVEKEFTICQIQNKLILNGTEYTLKGIVQYEAPIHYTVNCLRSNNEWYNFNDLSQTITKTSSKIVPHILIYVKKI